MLFSEWLFTPAGLEPVLRVRPLFREFLAQIGIILRLLQQSPHQPDPERSKGARQKINPEHQVLRSYTDPR